MKQKITILLFAVMLLTPMNTYALTVNQLRSKINALDKAYKLTQSKKNQTASQLNEVKKKTTDTKNKIADSKQEIINRQQDIEKLNKNISSKSKEIKEVAKYMQVSNGDTFFLDYILNASSVKDLIYRVTIAKQIVSYNDQLMKQMDHAVADNKQKQAELNDLKADLVQQQSNLELQSLQLYQQQAKLGEEYRDVGAQIKTARSLLNDAVKRGCKPTQNIYTCMNVVSSGTFIRPFANGYVTSNFGPRTSPCSGCSTYHRGIDLSNSNKSVSIYAIGNGKVADAYYSSSSGWTVDILHTVNGKRYTSTYMHMRSRPSVSKGQQVSTSTKLGTMGNTGNSSGAHLHLQVATCWRYIDCTTTFNSKSINPRNVISFPSKLYSGWSGR